MTQENKLHVLIIETNPSDAELIQEELNKVLDNYSVTVIDKAIDYVDALGALTPDLIVSDFQMPTFDALSALKIRHDKYPNIPFIVLTRSVNEEIAVDCMKAGADDYVLKKHINRLGRASLNAIEKKKNELESSEGENKLLKSELKFRLLADTSYDWDYMADINGKWLYISPGCKKITGLSNKELLNDRKLFYDMIHPDYSGHVKKHFESETVLNSSIEDLDFPIINRHNEVKWISHRCSPILNNGGRLIGRRGNNRDITKRMQREKERNVTLESALKANSVKTLFLANISHEIRTPLTSILGNTDFIESLLTENPNEHIKECFNSIKISGDRLMNTVHGILDLSLIESGNFPHDPGFIQLSKIIEYVIMQYKPIADKKKIKLSYKNQTEDLAIMADADNLIKALSNIIDNAIKYTDEGQVAIKLNYDNGKYILTITDTGVGIEKEYLNQIFDAFSQERDDFTVKYQGLGMGMAITKHCLEMDDASIAIDSIKGEGTTVTITF